MTLAEIRQAIEELSSIAFDNTSEDWKKSGAYLNEAGKKRFMEKYNEITNAIAILLDYCNELRRKEIERSEQ